MLKGHTKIELTDVNTGDVEVIEKNNMVTNALNEWFKTVPFFSVPSFDDYPMSIGVTDLLGGIMLFDDTIEEDADTIFPPASVGLTGCGAYGATNGGVPTCRGSYNETESVIDTSNKTAKFVYDFTTAQANGTIASVCLTSRVGGYTSCGNASLSDSVQNCSFDYHDTNNGRSTTIGGQVPVGIYNGTVYSVKVDTASNTITLYYGDAHYNSFSIFDTYNSFERAESKVIAPSIAVTTYYYTYFDRDSAKIYVLCYASSSKGYIVTEITLADLSVNEYLIPLSTFQAGYTYVNPMCVYSGYLYTYCYNSDEIVTICKLQLSSPTNVTTIATNLSKDWFGYNTFKVIRNGIIYMANYTSYKFVKDYNKCVLALNTIKNKLYCTELFIDQAALYNDYRWYDADNMVLNTSKSGTGSIMLPNYLATINNLEKPVVKTADKTMKITYTITEE